MQHTSVTLRPQTADDASFLFTLYASTRAEEMKRVPWSEPEKDMFLRMQYRAQSEDYARNFAGGEFLVIEHDKVAIGRLYVIRWQEEIHLIDIALMPEWRGKRIGRELIEDLLDEGKESGRKVTIYVEHFNPAVRLYRRLGFRETSQNGVYHFMEWQPSGAAR